MEFFKIEPRLLSEIEAARYLSISANTLRKQRSDGQRENYMPIVPFIQVGRSVKYLREELDAYIDERIAESRSAESGVLND